MNIGSVQNSTAIDPRKAVDGVNSAPKGSAKAVQEEVKKESEDKDKDKVKKQLIEVTEKLNKEMSGLNTSLKFQFNNDIEALSVSVIDTNTNKELRKFPSDEAIELYKKMRELVGMLFDKEA